MGNQKQLWTVIASQEVQVLRLQIGIFERLTRESFADIIVSYGWCWYTSAVPFMMLDAAISCFQLHQSYNRAQEVTIDVFGNTIVWCHMELGASPLIVFQDHASDKSVNDWSWFDQNEAYILASALEIFLLNSLVSGLSLEDRKKIDVPIWNI